MSDFETLLDTPKRKTVQTEVGQLRVELKTFERTFAETHGKKPKQSDIRNDKTIVAKYRRYNRLQDVLSGKITFEELAETPQKKTKPQNKKYERTGPGVPGHSETRTPPKRQKTAVYSSPPQRILINAIGPTPHRDGKVLGLFDLLHGSGSAKTSVTPTSSARKRTLEEMYSDTPVQELPLKAIQAQTQRPRQKEGDLLEFLTGTPQKSATYYKNIKYSRTPRSNCRKFALSQLFATPSTQRFLCAEHSETTPLRAFVLGKTPEKVIDGTGLDATPTYLKRSTSFKDRLLSAASSPALKNAQTQVQSVKPIGPPTLRHFRSSTSNILLRKDIQDPTQKPQYDGESDHEDDWAALRELEQEAQGDDFLVEDSQILGDVDVVPNLAIEANNTQVSKYKKKGQKRTTKKSNIKPVTQKAADEPRFVAADNSEDDEDLRREGDVMEEKAPANGEDEFVNSSRSKKAKHKADGQGVYDAEPTKPKGHGMINPNAQSHQNFRSLKIRNKNSKAKGFGRSRFGKGRR